jgi:hypothetical protein
MVIMSPTHKALAATFAGIAQQRHEVGDSGKVKIIAGADVYVSDFGSVQFVPSRFTSGRDAFVVDPEYWDIADLDGLVVEDLAKTGLAKRKLMRREWALRSKNERASGVVADLS